MFIIETSSQNYNINKRFVHFNIHSASKIPKLQNIWIQTSEVLLII